MLNPRVGLITLVSSPLIFKTIVVFPELSNPLHSNQYKQALTRTNFLPKNKRGFVREKERDRKSKATHTIRIRISFSFLLIFRMMLRRPIEKRSKLRKSNCSRRSPSPPRKGGKKWKYRDAVVVAFLFYGCGHFLDQALSS